jgi:mannose-6-phosphate isomerase-like protein (cupin superfamily)/predicted metal-dependent HD superfamily phosphohydrolase
MSLALDEALSQLSLPKPAPPTKKTVSATAPTSASKVQQNTQSSTTTGTAKSPYALLQQPTSPQQYYEHALPRDNLLANKPRTTVHMLGRRFTALCSRVLPFGNVGELELQVLALTSTGYAQDGEGTDIWLHKARLSREFGRRWYQQLRQVYSEPHRALHTFTKVALILSYLDLFASPILDDSDKNLNKGSPNLAKTKKTNSASRKKMSPRKQAQTAAEVIGSAHVSRKDALELAVWFQDSVCNPGEGDVISKRESANLFECFARDGGLPDADRCRISRMIRHTAIFSSANSLGTQKEAKKTASPTSSSSSSSSPSSSSASSFSFQLDAAMLRSFNRIFLFGGLRSVHCERSHRLRLEYRHLPDAKWCKRRAGILREYLSLKRFLEPNGGSVWMKQGELRDQVEREIRCNLQYEIDALRSGELPGYETIMKKAGGPVLPLLDLPRYMDGGSSQVFVTPLVHGSGASGSASGVGGLVSTGSTGTAKHPNIASSVSHCVIVPGGRTLRQSRATPVVYYVLSGIGEVFRGGRMDDVKKNDTINVCANTVHYFINRHRQQELYVLIIGSSLSAAVLE